MFTIISSRPKAKPGKKRRHLFLLKILKENYLITKDLPNRCHTFLSTTSWPTRNKGNLKAHKLSPQNSCLTRESWEGGRNHFYLHDPLKTHKIIKLKLIENLQEILVNYSHQQRIYCWSPKSLLTHSPSNPFTFAKHLSCSSLGTRDLEDRRHIYLQGTHDLTEWYTCTQLLHSKC